MGADLREIVCSERRTEESSPFRGFCFLCEVGDEMVN